MPLLVGCYKQRNEVLTYMATLSNIGTAQYINRKGIFKMLNKETEIEKLEREIEELKARRKEILDKAKNEEAEKKAIRKKEVEAAYDKFVELLEAYEKDFGGGYKVSLSGKFSM